MPKTSIGRKKLEELLRQLKIDHNLSDEQLEKVRKRNRIAIEKYIRKHNKINVKVR